MSVIERARANLRRWRHDSIAFGREQFGFEPDEWQADFLRAFSNQDIPRQRIALQACAGPGKTAALAVAGLNFLSCYGERGEHPKGAAVSITGDNLRDNLWAELNKFYNRSEYLKAAFGFTSQKIFARDHEGTWFLSARTFSRTANEEELGRTLSGLHSKYVIVLVDESGDIKIAIMKAAEQAFSSCKFGRLCQAGNPTSLDGMLYAASTEFAHLWHLIRITGDPEDPKRSPRIPLDWAREQIETHGRTDPWVMAYILGLFPPASINQLLGPDEVMTAMGRVLREEDYIFVQKRLGIDMARFGNDSTIIFPRQGLAAFKPRELRKQNTFDVSAAIEQAKANFGSEVEFVDSCGGFSAGVEDAMIQAGKPLIPVDSSLPADDPRYFNKRSEMHFRMAEWVKRGGALPNDPELKRQLVALTYTFFKGKFRVEEKDKIKAKLKGKSPDKSDALSYTFAQPDVPASFESMAQAEPRSPLRQAAKLLDRDRTANDMKTDYDPYDEKRW